MTESTALIKQLRQQIERANQAYYGEDDPLMTDAEYDALWQQLVQLEQSLPEAERLDSPTARVGVQATSRFTPFTHPTPMRSLSNVFDANEARTFFRRIEKISGQRAVRYSAELKLDGIAVNLIYDKGVLKTAATRGDGEVGEDITDNVKTISTLPKHIKSAPEQLEVRGEVVIHYDDFLALNDQQRTNNAKLFANPRNAAAGSLRQINAAITATRPLLFYAHGLGSGTTTDLPSTQSAALVWLDQRGFMTVQPRLNSAEVNALLVYHATMQEQRADIAFAIDGVVYKVDDFALQTQIGHIARAPRFAIAHKFPADIATTILRQIDLQVGRTGVLTPVARLAPVTVGGVVIANATLHNLDFIAEKEVRLGDYVDVRRAGDVIPAIVRVIKDKRPSDSVAWTPPPHCPSCHQPIWYQGLYPYTGFVACPGYADVELLSLQNDLLATLLTKPGREEYRCDNKQCDGRRLAAITHFVSRKAMDIDGIGDVLLEKLFAAGFVRTAADLFTLKKEALLSLALVGDVLATKILSRIDAAKRTTSTRFLVALGIPSVGETVASTLLDFFGRFDKLINAPQPVFAFIRNIGAETATTIHHFFAGGDSRRLVSDLLAAGITWEERLPDAPRRRSLKHFLTAISTFKYFVNDPTKQHILPRGLGKNAIMKLSTHFVDLPSLQAATEDELTTVLVKYSGLATRLRRFFEDDYYRQVINFLSELGFVWERLPEESVDDTLPWQGKTVVLTGILAGMTRQAATAHVQSIGGRVVGQVSNQVSYVIAGKNAGSKLTAAKQRNIPVLSEAEFINQLAVATNDRTD